MKKLLLFVIACTLGLFGTVSAQETITIGQGADENYDVPLATYYYGSYSQQSYTKAEIEEAGGSAGTITSVAFNVSKIGTTLTNRVLKVFMTNIDTEESVNFSLYTGVRNYPLPNLDGLVFDGTVDFNTIGWVEIPFTTPFVYNGNHLLITVVDNTDDSENADIYFRVDMKVEYSGNDPLNWATNGNTTNPPIDPTEFSMGGQPNTYRNQIQFTFAAAGEGGEEPEPTPEPEQPGGEELASEFSFDFEDGTLTGLRAFAGEGSSAPLWAVGNVGNGTGIFSMSYNATTWMTYVDVDNYVVTENQYQITENSVLSWYLSHSNPDFAYADVCAVVVSEDGETFTTVEEYLYDEAATTKECSLAAYAGKNLYVGFRHYCVDEYGGESLILDDIKLSLVEGGETPDPTPVAPAAPVVEATVTETTVTLTWEAVENATYYNIYTPSSFAENILGLTETTYTFEGLTAGTEYCFEVSAGNDVDESAATEICATTEEAEIEEPTGDLCVIDITLEDSYGDGWNGNILKIEYGTTSKEFTLSTGKLATETMEIPSGSHVTATYICTTGYGYPQENGFTIAYESGEVIVSVAKNTYAMNTPVTQAYEFDLDCTPKAPATPVVKAVATGGSTIELTITSAGAESYNIYNGTETVATGVTENPYTVEGLAADTEYCFTVVAVNEIGSSEASEAVCATTFAEGTVIVSVGEGNIAQMSAPIYNAGPGAVHSLSQQIYTAEEIGIDGNADIFSISFHHATGNNNVRNIVVYMQNVDADAYTR